MSNGIRQGWPSTIKINWLLASGFDGKLLILIMAFMADWKSDIRTHWFSFYMISYPHTWVLRSYRSFNTAPLSANCTNLMFLYCFVNVCSCWRRFQESYTTLLSCLFPGRWGLKRLKVSILTHNMCFICLQINMLISYCENDTWNFHEW